MALLRTLTILAIVFVIRADIPTSEVDIGLLNDVTFEWNVQEIIKEATARVREVKVTSKATQSGLAPYVGKISSGALLFVADSDISRSWEYKLLKEILNATHHNTANANIETIRASLSAVTRILNDFRRIPDLTETSKISMSNDIHSNVLAILQVFSDSQSIFRLHPQVAIMPLTSLASLVTASYPLFSELIPEFRNKLFVACELKNILIEYRRLVFYHRIRNLQFKTTPMVNTPGQRIDSNRDYLIISLLQNMQKGGPIKNFTSIRCDKSAPSNVSYRSIEDRVTSREYYTVRWNCFDDYIELIQANTVKAFQVPYQAMENVCSHDVESRRKKTGSGWLTVAVNSGFATTLSDYSKCDMFSMCDPEVRLFVNDREYRRTDVSDPISNYVEFFEIWRTEKIDQYARIKLELRDDDGGGSSEFIKSCPITIRDILSEQVTCMDVIAGNRLSYNLFWTDEYNDNRT